MLPSGRVVRSLKNSKFPRYLSVYFIVYLSVYFINVMLHMFLLLILVFEMCYTKLFFFFLCFSGPSISQRDWKPLQKVTPMTEDTRKKIFYSELLYILKPLLHLGCVYKYGFDTWQPFLMSLSIDLTCKTVLYQERHFLHKKDQEESSRRAIMLLVYLLKSPFYERHTRLRLERLLLSLSKYRLLKLVCNPLREYIPYWQSTYFYLWSS